MNTRADGRLTTKKPLCSARIRVKQTLRHAGAGQHLDSDVPASLVGTPACAGVTTCRGRQKGRTITSTTISTTAIPGSSFISRSALPLTGRAPAASLRPYPTIQP